MQLEPLGGWPQRRGLEAPGNSWGQERMSPLTSGPVEDRSGARLGQGPLAFYTQLLDTKSVREEENTICSALSLSGH